MRVTRVIARLELGGTQLGALRLTRALARQGIQTRVLAGEASEEAQRLFADQGVDVETWGRKRGMQYALEPAFAEWLAPRLSAADLVHAQMLGAWWAAAHSVADEVALVASEHNALQWPGPSREPELAAALLRVDAFSAHGPAVTETVLRLGLPPSRLVPGRSSIEWPLAGPAIDLPGSRIVFAGRLHREKGPDLLLEAMARLADPPLCVMLGSGPERANLEGQARALGIERHVLMPGWHRQVAPWLLGAKAAVVASRHEAWSQAAVTAMAAGVPVIGASVEGLPQTLGEGRGILVPPQDPAALADAIARVLGGERPDLEAARAYALRFTPERVAAYYERIYSDAIARRREERAAATERRVA